MHKKNKKLLLNLIVLSAIACAVVSVLAPCISLDLSNLLEEYGYEDPDYYHIIEVSPVIWHVTTHDFRDPSNPTIGHEYIFLNLLTFGDGKGIDINTIVVKDPKVYFGESNSIINVLSIIYVILDVLVFSLFFYFFYMGIKNIGVKKTRYFLYSTILGVIILVLFVIGSYYVFDIIDLDNLGYIYFVNFGYGFYLGILSIILFFIVYIIQQYFWIFSEEKNPKTKD
jgi:hypothetical protein